MKGTERKLSLHSVSMGTEAEFVFKEESSEIQCRNMRDNDQNESL